MTNRLTRSWGGTPRRRFKRDPRGLVHLAIFFRLLSTGPIAMIFHRTFLFALVLCGQCTAGEPPQQLSAMRVSELPPGTDPRRFPSGAESVGALHMTETVNSLDAEDALKYLPGIFLRKRNPGDTQATMATRIWGVSSSARSLIFA